MVEVGVEVGSWLRSGGHAEPGAYAGHARVGLLVVEGDVVVQHAPELPDLGLGDPVGLAARALVVVHDVDAELVHRGAPRARHPLDEGEGPQPRVSALDPLALDVAGVAAGGLVQHAVARLRRREVPVLHGPEQRFVLGPHVVAPQEEEVRVPWPVDEFPVLLEGDRLAAGRDLEGSGLQVVAPLAVEVGAAEGVREAEEMADLVGEIRVPVAVDLVSVDEDGPGSPGVDPVASHAHRGHPEGDGLHRAEERRGPDEPLPRGQRHLRREGVAGQVGERLAELEPHLPPGDGPPLVQVDEVRHRVLLQAAEEERDAGPGEDLVRLGDARLQVVEPDQIRRALVDPAAILGRAGQRRVAALAGPHHLHHTHRDDPRRQRRGGGPGGGRGRFAATAQKNRREKQQCEEVAHRGKLSPGAARGQGVLRREGGAFALQFLGLLRLGEALPWPP